MHASIAFVNGAGVRRRNRSARNLFDSLALLNTLLASPTNPGETEEEDGVEPVSKPGGFANDPDDPKNPNEVRERHQRKVRPLDQP
jgi:hypothetical protein